MTLARGGTKQWSGVFRPPESLNSARINRMIGCFFVVVFSPTMMMSFVVLTARPAEPRRRLFWDLDQGSQTADDARAARVTGGTSRLLSHAPHKSVSF